MSKYQKNYCELWILVLVDVGDNISCVNIPMAFSTSYDKLKEIKNSCNYKDVSEIIKYIIVNCEFECPSAQFYCISQKDSDEWIIVYTSQLEEYKKLGYLISKSILPDIYYAEGLMK